MAQLIKDFFGEDLHSGDTVLVESGSGIYPGRVSHYSNAGNIIVYYLHTKTGVNGSRRIIADYISDYKVIKTTDPKIVHFCSFITIKGGEDPDA